MRIRYLLAACLLASAAGIPTAAPASAQVATPALGAVVQGDVTGVLDPLIGSSVTVFDATTGKVLRTTPTDAQSGFRITGLPAARVKIRASAPGWMPCYANGKSSWATADVFTLHAGQTLTLPFASLDLLPEAVVSGTVRAAAPHGGPVAGAHVVVLDATTGATLRSATTGPDGAYRIGRLSILHNVKVRATAAGFLPAFNGGATTFASAPLIHLDLAIVGTVFTENLSMTRRPLGAAVAGQVLRWMDPYGHETVVVFNAATGKPLKSTTTDGEGNFRIGGLPAIGVKIRASAPGQWLPSFASNKVTLATADVFTLVDGQTLTLPIDSLDLAPEAIVAGKVTRVGTPGYPVRGAEVVVLDAATGKALKATRTAADGTYRIAGLATQPQIKVRATAPGLLPVFNGAAATFAGAPSIDLLNDLGTITTVNLAMSRAPHHASGPYALVATP